MCVCVCVCVCLYIYIYIHTYIHPYIIYIYIYTHTHERGLTCVHHVVLLQKKNDLLIEYAKKGATGGALMALQAGADVNHKDRV